MNKAWNSVEHFGISQNIFNLCSLAYLTNCLGMYWCNYDVSFINK